MIDIMTYINTGAVIILLGAVIFLLVRINKMKQRMDRFLGERSKKRGLEDMLEQCLADLQTLDGRYHDLTALVDGVSRRLSFCVQKAAVIRFNPFSDMGGDFSFALALLDENNNGLVLSSLLSREGSYTYAKTIVNLDGQHKLSPEEKQVVMMAAESKGIRLD